MADKGWTDGNALKDLRAPQSTKPHFDLIPDQVRAKLFELFPQDTYLGSRNLAILAILSDTGLRREEVANLLHKNVDLDAQVLKVYSDKTEEWRYVPLTDEAVALVRNHLKWRERYFAQVARPRLHGDQNHRRREARSVRSDGLFLTPDGRSLSPHGVGLILERASKKVGYRIHAHLFRHDWITRKALDGESPSVVKRWAGHKSYAMTDYYFGLAEEMLGAIKPKKSVLASLALPGIRRRGRPPKAAAK
ncbi:MAG: site-specific integrase [Chloroflexi bacterium]|nr:site-specific integrase [Chloroflexota bacterium]